MENWLQSIPSGETIVYLGSKTLEGGAIPRGIEELSSSFKWRTSYDAKAYELGC